LGELLAAASVYRHHLTTNRHVRRQWAWLVELARLLRLEDETGQRRQARQVKQEVQAFLAHLEQQTVGTLEDVHIAQHIVHTIRKRWWGLFICYSISGLPATNNAHETFFNQLKHNQRRINGHKSVHHFIMRYGVYAAYLDPQETYEQLLVRLSSVSHEEFQLARQAWRESEAPLHKTHRFRCHRARFLKELEADWEKHKQV
jgi:YesN/AraC family two-component response regulator